MSESRYFIDTNIFLRAVVADDPSQITACHRLIEKIDSGEIRALTSDLVLAEIVWTCLKFYKLNKQRVVTLLAGLSSMRGLIFSNDSDLLQAIELYSNYKVKFIDAMIATHIFFANPNNAIISYDKDFDKLKINRLEPDEID